MKKLLLALVFATVSSAAFAAEPLTEQQMDDVTAGLRLTNGVVFDFNSQTGHLRAEGFVVISSDSSFAVDAINMNTESIRVCSSCTFAISQSGVTITDASGHIIWDSGPAWLRANPQDLQDLLVKAIPISTK
jgi:hypothetical protein